MARFRPATRAWFIGCALAAALTTGLALRQPGVAPRDWLGFAILGLCAAVAHRFPIKTSSSASSRLTNVFLVAGALTLPTALLTPLVLLALVPDSVAGKRRSAIAVRLLANAPPTILACQLAAIFVQQTGVTQIMGPFDLGVALVAAFALTLCQNLLLGAGMALEARLPLFRVEPLSRVALLTDSLFAGLGIVVAGLWLDAAILLPIVLPLLVIAYHLTRTARLAGLAQVDDKTGLYNARYFEQALGEELAHALRLDRPLGLLFADLDHFKEVNDRHGHAVGDHVLQEFAALFATTLRTGDIVARFGGEEFVALLPGTDPDEALYIAERVRAATATHAFALPDGGTLRRTVSIGVASCPQDATTVEALLERADLAMYRAKQTRDAVVRSGSLPAVPRLRREEPARAPAASRPAAASPLAAGMLWGTVALGTVALLWSIATVAQGGRWASLLPLLALALAAEFLTVPFFESQKQRMSLSFTIAVVMAAVAIQPGAAPLVGASAALLHIVQQRQWRRGIGRVLFNLTNSALAAALASGCYLLLGPLDAGRFVLVSIALATLAYVIANVGIVALNVAAHTGRSVAGIIGDSLWSVPITLLLGLTGGFLGLVHGQLGATGTILFAVPLLVMRFTLAYAARKHRQAIATLEIAKGEVEQAHAEKEQTLRQLIATVAAIIDARDQAVAGHSERVATYAIAIGEELGIAPRELDYLQTAGLLHDLGKVAVPETILHKPAKLTAEEFAIVKRHAALGERILAEVKPLVEVARMVGDHHERFDGTGYPNRKVGTAITQGGRILAVADTLDSILSDRPYSAGKPLAWALAELDRCAGLHFDPAIVAALQRVAAARGPEFFVRGIGGQDVEGAGLHGVLIPFPSIRQDTAAAVALRR